MKAAIVFGGSGPILVLTTYADLKGAKFVEKMATKGIDRFIAYEVNLETAHQRYGQHFETIINDVQQQDDLRVLDYNGFRIMHNFSLTKELGPPLIHE